MGEAELGGVEGGETAARVYCIKEELKKIIIDHEVLKAKKAYEPQSASQRSVCRKA